jgi:hypothetical protein
MAALGSGHSALLKKLGELSFRAVDPDILGTPVPREAFDPSFDLAGVDVAGLIDAMLVKIGSESNPFLRTAEELAEIGFAGTPYRYHEEQ